MPLSQILMRRRPWNKGLITKLSNPDYRHEYVSGHVKTWVARQIRALREARGWSQSVLGERSGKKQSVISRLEDPEYGQLTVQTLLEVAAAFDVALEVRFVDFPTFLTHSRDLRASSMTVGPFNGTLLAAMADSPQTIFASDYASGAGIRKFFGDVNRSEAPTPRFAALSRWDANDMAASTGSTTIQ